MNYFYIKKLLDKINKHSHANKYLINNLHVYTSVNFITAIALIHVMIELTNYLIILLN